MILHCHDNLGWPKQAVALAIARLHDPDHRVRRDVVPVAGDGCHGFVPVWIEWLVHGLDRLHSLFLQQLYGPSMRQFNAAAQPFSFASLSCQGPLQIIHHLQARDIGILITDHNVRDTLDICEKAYIVGDGHIIAAGNAHEILANERVRKTYLGDQFSL